jgi:hypothetical protein
VGPKNKTIVGLCVYCTFVSQLKANVGNYWVQRIAIHRDCKEERGAEVCLSSRNPSHRTCHFSLPNCPPTHFCFLSYPFYPLNPHPLPPFIFFSTIFLVSCFVNNDPWKTITCRLRPSLFVDVTYTFSYILRKCKRYQRLCSTLRSANITMNSTYVYDYLILFHGLMNFMDTNAKCLSEPSLPVTLAAEFLYR